LESDIESLPPLPLLIAFIAASALLAITPGPGVAYIVTRSLMHGRRSGLASVLGIALGNLGNAFGAGLGLAALFSLSSLAFTAMKWAGAAYLIYLGVRALRDARRLPAEEAAVLDAAAHTNPIASRAAAPMVSPGALPVPRHTFRDAFIVALLNPKTALFFAAFLPQFVTDNGSAALQTLALGALFVAVAAATDTLYALGASALAAWLKPTPRLRRVGRYVSGGALIGLGLGAALFGNRK
jgi:threonine/homoserine/homoserine lactone efflux protein